MVTVIAPGSIVKLATGTQEPIEGVVVDVLLSDKFYVQYKVQWWDGRTRRLEYFEEFAVTPADNSIPSLKIGFK